MKAEISMRRKTTLYLALLLLGGGEVLSKDFIISRVHNIGTLDNLLCMSPLRATRTLNK